MNKAKKGKLYLIPTPLAENSLDQSVMPQSREIIKQLDRFIVEKVRTARRFIASLKMGVNIEELHFELLDKNTSQQQVSEYCQSLLNGTDIGVMSEAGCPGIADPGNLAIKFAHKHDVEVVPLVGPSSIFMALMASGFNGQSFAFHGYLPIDKSKRKQRIADLEQAALRHKQTQIFMETPFRNEQLLEDILKFCKPDTVLCIAKDITGPAQQIEMKPIKQWNNSRIELHKIPTVFLLHTD